MRNVFGKFVLLTFGVRALFSCADRSKEIEYVTVARWQDGMCLAYLASFLDSDMDGYSDEDENALGTDPNDPSSFPSVPKLIDEISSGGLQSFNRQLNEIIVLPEKLPDGTPIGETALSGYKKETLKKLGITSETLKKFGLSFETGFTIESAMPEGLPKPNAGSKKPPFTTMVGGIDIALISKYPSPAPSEAPSPTGGETVVGGDAQNTETLTDKARKQAEEAQKKADEAARKAADAGWLSSERAEAVKAQASANVSRLAYEALKLATESANKSKEKPDGGTKQYVDSEIAPVVILTKKDFEVAWYKSKGGMVSRPVNPGGGGSPIEGLEPPPQVLGLDPNGPIILVDPEQTEYPLKHSIILFPPKKPSNKKEQNTNFGPTIIEIINFGSGFTGGTEPADDPRTDPN